MLLMVLPNSSSILRRTEPEPFFRTWLNCSYSPWISVRKCSVPLGRFRMDWRLMISVEAAAIFLNLLFHFVHEIQPFYVTSRSERIPCLGVRSPSVNFLGKVIHLFYLTRARLHAPSVVRIGCRKHRVCSTLFFNTFQENVNTLRQTSSPWHPSTSSVHDFTR